MEDRAAGPAAVPSCATCTSTVVLVLEIWLEYRRDLVLHHQQSTGLARIFYGLLTLGSLFYAFIVDFSLELVDLIHRIYESDESFRALDFMVHTRLFTSQIVLQILIGTVVPLLMLATTQLLSLSPATRLRVYIVAGALTLVGIFAMRWNVVIGGQLFSKSVLGYTSYKLQFATKEGLLPAVGLLVAPFFILWARVHFLPPWSPDPAEADAAATRA